MNKNWSFSLIFIAFFVAICLYSYGTGNDQPQTTIKENYNTNLSARTINVNNSGDLGLSAVDISNQTISWSLTEEGPFDYLGAYSFTEDPNGAHPAGWIIYEDHPSTTTEIVELLEGHRKVVELYDNYGTGDTAIESLFANQASGTIEYWFYGIGAASGSNYVDTGAYLKGIPNRCGPNIRFDLDLFEIQYILNGSFNTITSFNENEWVHMRIQFNCSSYTYEIWVNGLYQGIFAFTYNVNYLNGFCFTSGTMSSGGHYGYVDAVDYSWAPGYYTNRNMDTGPLDYLGAYSFSEDIMGSDPIGFFTNEPASTSISVVESYENHHKLAYLDDNSVSAYCEMNTTFTGVSSGAVEMWFLMPDVSTPLGISLKDEDNTGYVGGIAVSYDYRGGAENWLSYYNGTIYDLVQLTDNTWYHLRFSFECTTGNFDNLAQYTWCFYLNDVRYGPFNFSSIQSNVGWLRIHTYDFPRQPSEVYIDAIDFSWAPGYYTNRNMDSVLSEARDYQGTYSFTNDVDGSNPDGWTILEEPTNTHIDIVGQVDNHRKVLELWDNSTIGRARVYNSFSSVTSGAIEFWLYYVKGSENWIKINTKDNGGWDNVHLRLNVGGAGELACYDGAHTPICNLSEETWHHIRITFEHAAGNFDNLSSNYFNIYVNGIKYGPYAFANYPMILDETTEIHFVTETSLASSDFHFWLDAVDYSWAPGYYPNRNMDWIVNYKTQYAIFQNGTQRTSWQTWSNQIDVSYNVSGLSLGEGIHNISLVYTDEAGNLHHDDVIVTVSSSVVIDWNVEEDLEFDIDPWKDRQCEISFVFNNTGTTTFLFLNFTIKLPEGWSVDIATKLFTSLGPNEVITVEFVVTTPSNAKEFIEEIEISFEAYILETGGQYQDTITLYIIGKKVKDMMIWLILIVGGAVAAVGTTSYMVIRRRRDALEGGKWQKKFKSAYTFKTEINVKFPGTYTTIAEDLVERVKAFQGITDEERKLLIQDLAQLDDEDAKKWIDDFEKSLMN